MQAFEIMTDYVDRAQLATALRVSPRTVMRMEQRPDGLPSLIVGGRKFYRVSSVKDWLAKRETHPNPRGR